MTMRAEVGQLISEEKEARAMAGNEWRVGGREREEGKLGLAFWS